MFHNTLHTKTTSIVVTDVWAVHIVWYSLYWLIYPKAGSMFVLCVIMETMVVDVLLHLDETP